MHGGSRAHHATGLVAAVSQTADVVSATFGNANVQYFYQDWYAPKDGCYESPAGPGFGYALDEGKIRSRVELP